MKYIRKTLNSTANRALKHLHRNSFGIPALCILSLFSSATHADDCVYEKQAALPITFQGVLPVTSATINGQTITVLIDTGAQSTLITPETKATLGLPDYVFNSRTLRVYNTENEKGVGDRVNAVKVLVNDFEFAGVHYPQKTMAVVPLRLSLATADTQSADIPPDVGGIVGDDILGNYDLDFDFTHQQLTLYHVRNCQRLSAPWQGAEVETVPFSFTKAHQPVISVELNGQPLKAIFDSGNSNLALDINSTHAIGITADMLEQDPKASQTAIGARIHQVPVHTIDSFKIGEDTFHNIHATVVDLLGAEGNLLIGEDYIHNHRLWLSNATKTLLVMKPVNAASLGPVYQNSFRIGSFTLPLPPGKWVLLASGKMSSQQSIGEGYFLGKVSQNQLEAGILAIAKTAKPDSPGGIDKFSWNNVSLSQSPDCNTGDSGAKQSCWIVHNYFTPLWKTGAQANTLDGRTQKNLTERGINSPQDLLAVTFLRNENEAGLMVTYLFNPEIFNIHSTSVPSETTSDWTPGNITHYPEKIVYVEQYKKWAAAYWNQFDKAFAQGETTQNSATVSQTR